MDRVIENAEVGFTMTIIPLADVYTESERRKSKPRERLEAACSKGWEDLVGDIIPPWPAVEFLKSLAVYFERITQSWQQRRSN